MKKKYFLNANIIDPHNSIDEVGGLIVNENGLIDPYQPHFNEGCRHVYLKLREIEEYSQSNK